MRPHREWKKRQLISPIECARGHRGAGLAVPSQFGQNVALITTPAGRRGPRETRAFSTLNTASHKSTIAAAGLSQ